MHKALDEYKVVGLPNNINFLKKVVNHPVFQSGVFDTSFIE